ncbi:DUF3221 domain-containing protein [Sporosarcina sp. Sa2YVA2]|uniref:DUF3221 domain-containing protein n=1 Tax=Sporosarcina quadrami TaxID=2762234 RepID=A0ABR8UB29_9BACL|nr:DUF3221 domain-containing protein [Sporosarcina quadrami]MBD7985227.1 DUF3221 domain-containing protein [Sporosarcina quadrami]
MKNRVALTMLGVAFLLGGCGAGSPDALRGSAIVDDHGWKTIKEVSGREIIAELKQTVKESSAREKKAEEQKEMPEYKDGVWGEPTPELAENLAIQAIEGPVALEAVENVYGNFDGEGVLFLENQFDGAEQSGVWIGVKEPDERLQQLLDVLQPKVDAGEILAEPIYIYRSLHTQKELYALQEDVAEVLKEMDQGRGSFSLSVNTITGDIEIGHDFLKSEQQKELEAKFLDHRFVFTQEGNMVAEPGEPSIIWADETYTETPVEEGGFLLSIKEGQIFVAGGTEDAIYYSFPEARELKVGMRVRVESTGMILESYPGQGSAKFVEVLPDYKPAGAMLSESEAVVKALDAYEKSPLDIMLIQRISYDTKKNVWIFNVLQDREDVSFEVEDR